MFLFWRAGVKIFRQSLGTDLEPDIHTGLQCRADDCISQDMSFLLGRVSVSGHQLPTACYNK